jgi:hypothetical protein
MKMAIDNGYTVIRLLQDDVYRDKNDCEHVSVHLIEKHIISYAQTMNTIIMKHYYISQNDSKLITYKS